RDRPLAQRRRLPPPPSVRRDRKLAAPGRGRPPLPGRAEPPALDELASALRSEERTQQSPELIGRSRQAERDSAPQVRGVDRESDDLGPSQPPVPAKPHRYGSTQRPRDLTSSTSRSGATASGTLRSTHSLPT